MGSILFRKLYRTMNKYRAQFVSMIIMIALGVAVFVGMNIEWYSIERNMTYFFETTHFADYRIISEKGFSERQLKRIQRIEGIDRTARFFSANMDAGSDGDTLAVTVTEDRGVSGLLIVEGEPYDPESPDGIWISDKYAKANGLKVGDDIKIKYNGREIRARIKAFIKAGEFLICIPDMSQILPDFDNHGFAYASPYFLKRLLGYEFYTQINVISELDKTDFTRLVNDCFTETPVIISKEDNISYSQAMGEVDEGKVMGNFLPVIFLAIAFLTMVTTMHRIAASEKIQMGTLKSLGFKSRRILFHYTSYAFMTGITGTIIGTGLGFYIGWYIMNPDGPMGIYMDFPEWNLYVPDFVWYGLLFMNIVIIFIGYASIKSMLAGSAADTLAPYVPGNMRAVFLEKLFFWKYFGFGTRWNIRDLFRHKARLAMSLIGISGCSMIMLASFGMNDSFRDFIDFFYEKTMLYETKINLDTENVSNGSAKSLCKKYEGDWGANLSIQIEKNNYPTDTYSLEIYGIENDYIRFSDDETKSIISLSDDGAYICRRIADKYDIKKGDIISFKIFGKKDSYSLRVEDIIQSMNESVVISAELADRVFIKYDISTIYTDKTAISSNKKILNIQTKKTIMGSLDTMLEIMNIMIAVFVIFSAGLGIIVLYSLGVMSYTERYREMATLKVIGFRNKKIGRILIDQNIWLTFLGIGIGIPAGYYILNLLMERLAPEYELSIQIRPISYILTVAITFGTSLIVGFMIAGKNKDIDMVEALKTGE